MQCDAGAKMHIAARAVSPLRRRLPLRSLSPLVRRSARRASSALRARRLRSVGPPRCSFVGARLRARRLRSVGPPRRSWRGAPADSARLLRRPAAVRSAPLSSSSLPPFLRLACSLALLLSRRLVAPSLPPPCVLAPPPPAASAPLSLRSLSTLHAAAPLRNRPGGKRIFAPASHCIEKLMRVKKKINLASRLPLRAPTNGNFA